MMLSLFKGIVQPEMKILSSFTHPEVVPNIYKLISAIEHKIRYLNVDNQTVMVAIYFVYGKKYYESQWPLSTVWFVFGDH